MDRCIVLEMLFNGCEPKSREKRALEVSESMRLGS